MSDIVYRTVNRCFLHTLIVGTALCVALGANSATADATIAKVEVFPPDVELSTTRDRQRFIVVATRDGRRDARRHSAGAGQAGESRPS